MHLTRLRFAFVCGLTVLCSNLLAQGKVEAEVYDSVKVDLKNGVLVQRYLPFDVPFYLHGDATDIESISLSIIDSEQLACCEDFLDPDARKSASSECDCSCESLQEQQLRFYQMVKKIELYGPKSELLGDKTLDKRLEKLKLLYEKKKSKKSKKSQNLEKSIDVWNEKLNTIIGKGYVQVEQMIALSKLDSDLYNLAASPKDEKSDWIQKGKPEYKERVLEIIKLFEVLSYWNDDLVKIGRDNYLQKVKSVNSKVDSLKRLVELRQDSINSWSEEVASKALKLIALTIIASQPNEDSVNRNDSLILKNILLSKEIHLYQDSILAARQKNQAQKADIISLEESIKTKDYKENLGEYLAVFKGVNIISLQIEKRYNELLLPNGKYFLISNKEINLKGSIESINSRAASLRRIIKDLEKFIRDTGWKIKGDEIEEKNRKLNQFTRCKKDSIGIPLFGLRDSIRINTAQVKIFESVMLSYRSLVDTTNKESMDKVWGENKIRVSALLSVYHSLDTLLQRKQLIAKQLKKEYDFRNQFHKKYQLNWGYYSKRMNKEICKGLFRNCDDCGFSPYKCNFVCGWQRDTVLPTDKFFLQIPPLEANKSYRFFFEVRRNVNNDENRDIKKVVAHNLLTGIDSLFNKRIDIQTEAALSIYEIRNELLSPNYVDADLEQIKQSIANYLEREYKGVTVSVDDIKFMDKHAVLKLLNSLISHKLYRMGLDTLFRDYSTTNPLSKITDGTLISTLKRKNFFDAKRMEEFYLLDTLNLMKRVQQLPAFNAHPAAQDVPIGLMPYINLQMVNERRLENVNDFDPKTSEVYLEYLTSYAAYLQRIQSFILDTLIRKNPKNLRLRLFAGSKYPEDPFVTSRARAGRDIGIQKSLFTLSELISTHQLRTAEAINVYKNYQSNLKSVNDQVVSILDSVFNNNRKVELAVLRNVGGVSSADFKTRAEWYISADVGLAYVPFGDAFKGQAFPYYGANFNLAPINRNAHYQLFKLSRFKKRQVYYQCKHPKKINRIFKHWYKASSVIVGVSTVDLEIPGRRDNLLDNNMNLLTGYGLRITEAARFNVGAIWMKRIDENPVISEERIKPYIFYSISLDIDVVSAMGAVGNFLFPNKTNGDE